MSAHHRPLDESDVVLIQRVKETPSLYDHRHGDFRLTQRKEGDWAKVAKSLNISSHDARRRWTCLRDRYSRELKQMRLHPSSEFGRNEFFRQMDFLREFVRKRRERSRRDDTPTSWLKTEVRATRLVKSQAESSLLDEQNMDESEVYEESEHNYDTKLEVHTSQSEGYSVLVEADDGHESFEEYMTDTPEHKVLPPLQQAPTVVTVQQTDVSSVPTTASTASAAATTTTVSSVTPAENINFMVCMPNANESVPQQLNTTGKPEAELITSGSCNENEDDFFCKSVAAYLRQLSRRHKIKAKVEIFQILEKYILIEESVATPGLNS